MFKTLFYSTCLFLWGLLSTGRLQASDHYSDALRFFSEGRLFEASIEFERAIYYENDSNHISLFKYYKALCYKGLVRYSDALGELEGINMRTLPDSLFLMIQYEKAICEYLNADIYQALIEIDVIKTRFSDSSDYISIIPLNILCLNATRNWGNALKLWNKYIEISQLSDSLKTAFKNGIRSIYRSENIPRYYSPEKAMRKSRFIPGSGQIYCGAALEGTFNLLLNVSLLGYSAWEFYSGYYLTGNYVGLGLFTKFYRGGIYRASNIAKARNEEEIKRFNLECSSVMISIFDSTPETTSVRNQ